MLLSFILVFTLISPLSGKKKGLAWHMMTALRYLGACNTCFKPWERHAHWNICCLAWLQQTSCYLSLPVPPVWLMITISSPAVPSWLRSDMNSLLIIIGTSCNLEGKENQRCFSYYYCLAEIFPDSRLHFFFSQFLLREPIWLRLVCRLPCDVELGPCIMVCGMSQRELVAAFLHSNRLQRQLCQWGGFGPSQPGLWIERD